MKIKMLSYYAGPEGNFFAGQEYEVDLQLGRKLIEAGAARGDLPVEKKKPGRPPKVEAKADE